MGTRYTQNPVPQYWTATFRLLRLLRMRHNCRACSTASLVHSFSAVLRLFPRLPFELPALAEPTNHKRPSSGHAPPSSPPGTRVDFTHTLLPYARCAQTSACDAVVDLAPTPAEAAPADRWAAYRSPSLRASHPPQPRQPFLPRRLMWGFGLLRSPPLLLLLPQLGIGIIAASRSHAGTMNLGGSTSARCSPSADGRRRHCLQLSTVPGADPQRCNELLLLAAAEGPERRDLSGDRTEELPPPPQHHVLYFPGDVQVTRGLPGTCSSSCACVLVS